MAFISANLADVQETTAPSYDALPAGEYIAVVSNVKERETNAGHLAYNVEFTVVDGPFQNRKLFQTLNINHPNETPRNISLAFLKALVIATGNDPATFEDTDALHDVPVTLVVTVKTSEKYGKQNEVRAVMSGTTSAPPAAPKPAQAASGGSAPPWAR